MIGRPRDIAAPIITPGRPMPREEDMQSDYVSILAGEFSLRPEQVRAVIELMDFYGIDLKGKGVAVIGRSLVIGKPVSMMLIKKNATVTVCHTRTRDVASVARNADIIVAAAGSAGMVTRDFVREGQTVIDVGINWSEEKQRIVGDVDFDAVDGIVDSITPVPGGVGGVTTSVLMSHVAEAAERKA